MGKLKRDHLQGSLDLIVLQTLASHREPLHGYAITEHIHRVSKDALRVEEGSLYPALHRMTEAGWIRAEWGVSSNNRRARYYAITRTGRQRLADLEREWTSHVKAIKRILKPA